MYNNLIFINSLYFFITFIIYILISVRYQIIVNSHNEKIDKRPLKILTLDGGGIRGFVELAILKEIEKKSNKSIRDIFDLIIGTSCGGVAAIHMAYSKNKTESCLELKRSLNNVRKLFSLYSNFSVLKNGYGCPINNTIETCYKTNPVKTYGKKLPPRPNRYIPHCSVVTATQDLYGDWYPYILRNYNIYNNLNNDTYKLSVTPGDSQWCLPDQLLATTAACSIFSPFIKDNIIYTDGGIVANTPSIIAINEAKNIWPNRPIKVIVSIGCGCDKNREKKKIYDMSICYWINKLIDIALNNSKTIDNDIKNIHIPKYYSDTGNRINYFRINPIITYVDPKEHRINIINNMSREVDEWIKKNSYIFDEICKNI